MTKPIRIALCMIAKNKEAIIERALESTKAVFDGYFLQDTGSSDKTVEIFGDWCKKHNKEFETNRKFLGKDYKFVTVQGVNLLADFGKARNDSFEMARKRGYDFAMWIDTDDRLEGVQLVRPLAEELNRNGEQLALMPYDYAGKTNGLSPVAQGRERLIDLRVPGKWVNRVHENYVFDQPVKFRNVDQINITHLRSNQESQETNRRNNLIMNEVIREEGIDKVDQKVLHDLAFDHWEHREFKQSLEYYEALIKRNTLSGEQLYYIFIKMARAYLGLGNMEQAIVIANRAMNIEIKIADSYLVLAEIYNSLNQLETAEYFINKVLEYGKPKTTAPVNEMEYTVVPMRIKIDIALKRGQIEEALKLVSELLKIYPDPQFKNEKFNFEGELVKSSAIQGIHKVYRYLQDNNEFGWTDRLVSAIPKGLRDNTQMRNLISEMKADFERKTYSVKLKDKKSIIFLAGRHYEQWDGNSDKTKGIGGSEGMTIQMARGLAKLGNKVVVYGEPRETSGQIIDGVLYEQADKYNSDMKADVFISLRNPGVFKKNIAAKKQYLWLHDTDYGEFPVANFYLPNKTIVLSEAHKEIIKINHGIRDDSIFWVTRNAYNELAYKEASETKIERKPFQLIYASSYDRGLDNALQVFKTIKGEVPQAEFKIYYGWNTYDAIMQSRQDQRMLEYKQKIIQTIAESDGVQELGRISQPELYKKFKESSLWFYPTQFYEISCITAMSAQAMGCIPVCTAYGALNETINTKLGVKADLKDMAEVVIDLLKNQEQLEARREPLAKWASEKYNMASLAQDWDKYFTNN